MPFEGINWILAKLYDNSVKLVFMKPYHSNG